MNLLLFFSISPEVYFIVLFIGLLIFFPVIFIVKKFVKSPLKRFITAFIISLISAPTLYICLGIIFYLSLTYCPNQSFNQEKWNANVDSRFVMSNDIAESKLLIGKTKSEVIEILGDGKNEMQDNSWTYNLGFVPGLGNVDPDFLVISFENDKVVKVEQYKS